MLTLEEKIRQFKLSKKDKEKIFSVGRKVKAAVTVCNEIFNKIPKQGDSALTKAVKTGAILNNIHKVYNDVTAIRDVKQYMHDKFNCEMHESDFLVPLLLNSGILHNFDIEIQYIGNSAYSTPLLHYKINDIERITFVSREVNPNPVSPTVYNNFYATKSLDFKKIFAPLWEQYGNMILVEKVLSADMKTQTKFMQVVADDAYLSLQCRERTKLVKNIVVGNCILLVGPPGTGKTNFSSYCASSENKKLLLISGTMLTGSYFYRDLILLLSYMQPDIVVIDDVDRTSIAQASQQTLKFFETLHKQLKGMKFLFSVNYPERLEQALIRSGRIDYIIEFKSPPEDEQKDILQHYLPDHDISELISYTNNLCHADLVAFAKRVALYGVDAAKDANDNLKKYRDLSSFFKPVTNEY